jgi:hypothetical protein
MDYLMCSSYELTGEADLIRTQFFFAKIAGSGANLDC